MILRPYTTQDAEALAALYRDAVVGIGATAYTPGQTASWVKFAEDLVLFREFIGQGQTLIAVVEGEPAAFCQRHPKDHIALLYTATRYARKGLATAVYDAVEAEARACKQPIFTTDASKISRPFFEKHGFTLLGTERVFREGEYFERYRMEKVLAP